MMIYVRSFYFYVDLSESTAKDDIPFLIMHKYSYLRLMCKKTIIDGYNKLR